MMKGLIEQRSLGSEQADLSAELVEWLSRPEHHPDRPSSVEVIETHISWVFLTKLYAYKLKKPVRFDFLDFTTPETRRWACEQELCLNRRLAHSVYLDLVPLVRRANGRLQLGGSGEPVDWLVKMRRLPSERRLDKLIRSGRLNDFEMVRVAKVLSGFYVQAPPLTLRPNQYLQSLEHHVRDNLHELLKFAGELPEVLIKRAHVVQLSLLKLLPHLLVGRVCDGRIVEGHGDLRPEHIYLTPIRRWSIASSLTLNFGRSTSPANSASFPSSATRSGPLVSVGI